jgi:hypothetical protein
MVQDETIQFTKRLNILELNKPLRLKKKKHLQKKKMRLHFRVKLKNTPLICINKAKQNSRMKNEKLSLVTKKKKKKKFLRRIET